MKNLLFRSWLTLLMVASISIVPCWAAARLPVPVDDPAGGPAPQDANSLLSLAVGIACPGCTVTDVQRQVITGKIAHYKFMVRTGPGAYDVIGIHRIVKESTPFGPVRARDSILLLHGDLLGFEGGFLGNLRSPGAAADQAFPVYLAQNGVDVWGIDQAWTLVPAEETDSSWAVGWGFDKELRNLKTAVRIARVVRTVTEGEGGKISLLGWSRGAQIILSYASAETQLPETLRDVKAYVYADVWFKFTDAAYRQAACDYYDYEAGLIASGNPLEVSGSLFIQLGTLARSDPAGASPIFPGLTNESAALVMGAVPFGYAYAWDYHLCAGIFDATGMPTGLQYTNVSRFFDWLPGASPYEPLQIEADGDAVGCERSDVPWDDHLGDIKAPILYIEAAGGAGGDTGRQTLAFLGQAPVTQLIIQLHPDDERGLDFGHVDLWNADNAPTLVWKPILSWMRSLK